MLGEAIKHPVKEEEGEMFKQARRADVDLEELGERMQAFKRKHGAENGDRPRRYRLQLYLVPEEGSRWQPR